MTVGPDIGPSPRLARLPARALLAPLLAALVGAALVGLLSQLPARHTVDVGGYDAAYAQGFYDAEAPDSPVLAGSDGAARWSRPAGSALLFPQAGLPGELRLRLRGWRPEGPPPRVTVLLNGAETLGEFQASGAWEERSFAIRSGLLKAGDFFVELRVEPALALGDGRAAGVLVDAAGYSVAGPPVLPYPAQLLYGALVGAMLALLAYAPAAAGAPPSLKLPLVGLLLYGLLWLLLYRLQPPLYPYPLKTLPQTICLGLAALLALRHGPAIAARAPALLAAAAPAAVIGLWTAATLLAARGHLTLARPGVENDFRVFATRETLDQVFSADGFYNLGYPLLLWLARPLAEGNAFLAGRLLAALSGAAFLAGGYWLARVLLPAGPALLALIALALSGLVAQYGLYVGSDMPFAACLSLCVAAIVAGRRAAGGGRQAALLFLAGLLGGAAFLMRHLGLVLLPWGLLVLLLSGLLPAAGVRPPAAALRAGALFAAGFLLAAAPQIVINTAQAGSPLYNQQAKNIWLAVYGGTDWGRWEEAPNDVGLAEVVLRDPGRFLGNWWGNIVGYLGSGAEDTSEFGRANQFRLLGWPANLLGALGLAWWAVAALSRREGERASLPHILSLVGLVAMYVAAVGTAFTLQRFFLPLAPIYAAAAAWALWRLAGGGRGRAVALRASELAPSGPAAARPPSRTGQASAQADARRGAPLRRGFSRRPNDVREQYPGGRWLLGVALALGVVLWGGWAGGARHALDLQPADEVAAVRMVEAGLPPGALMGARVSARLPLAKYSAIAHRVVNWPAGADAARAPTADDLAELRAAGASHLLWDEAEGPPPLADPDAAREASSGRYGLYRLGP